MNTLLNKYILHETIEKNLYNIKLLNKIYKNLYKFLQFKLDTCIIYFDNLF